MTFNETWEGDKDYFWAQHDARLQKIDDEQSEPPIEILPTFTDEDGVEWQLPHEDKMGWARLCFDALMDGGIMTATVKHPTKYKMEQGQMVACEWVYHSVCVFKTWDNNWHIDINGKKTFYPPSETHRVFVMAVGLRYDFSGVVLC